MRWMLASGSYHQHFTTLEEKSVPFSMTVRFSWGATVNISFNHISCLYKPLRFVVKSRFLTKIDHLQGVDVPSLQVKRSVLFAELHLWSSQIHSATSSCLLKTSWSRFTIAFGIFCQTFPQKHAFNKACDMVFPFRPLFLSRENSQLPTLHFHQHFLWLSRCRGD